MPQCGVQISQGIAITGEVGWDKVDGMEHGEPRNRKTHWKA